jgi:hypothetical protein
MKQALAPFNGPDPPFLPANRNSKAQTIKLQDENLDSATCRRADGTSMCGRLSNTFTDLKSHLKILNFPHKRIFYDASMNKVTLETQSNEPIGLHKVLITAYQPSFKDDALKTAEIAYFVHPAPENFLQNAKKLKPPETG